MVEELMYQKKQERKHNFRCCVVWIFDILLLIGLIAFDLWTLELIDSSVKNTVFGYVIGLWVISIGFVFTVMFASAALRDESKEKYIKEVNEIQFCAKVEDFMKSLEGKTIELKLKIEFDETPPLFTPNVIDSDRKWYVQKGYLQKLHIFTYYEDAEGIKEDLWWCDTDDYEFFFEWFEPIFEPEGKND